MPDFPNSTEDFHPPVFKNIIDIIKWVNKSYETRDKSTGIYYPDDYKKIYNFSGSWLELNGIYNPNFWNLDNTSKNNTKSSQALLSFFMGPTFADCSAVIQAGIYLLLLQDLGAIKFDQIFPTIKINTHLFDKENPFYEYFDICDNLDSNLFETGDIIHIKGVAEHDAKHFASCTGGWNLIYSREDNKYIGFGPLTFKDNLLSFDELKIKLINSYNEDQSDETLQIRDNMTDMAFLIVNKYLKNNKKTYQDNIIGIIKRVKFNKSKFYQEHDLH